MWALHLPAGVPRLYDLVKIKDDKLRPAFMYAMQNTLVADTLEQAARISYNSSDRRFKRVVTLQVGFWLTTMCTCRRVCVWLRMY
jgi:structural maintenance of chromosome 4